MDPDKAVETTSPPIRWRLRLLEHKPMVVPIIFLAAVSGGFMGVLLFKTPVMGLLGFAMILASTADYWLGTHYVVDSKGIQSRTGLSLTAMPWSDVKRVMIESAAVKLSPLEDGERLDAFRGVVLRTNSSIREDVLNLIHANVPEGTKFQEVAKEFPR